MEDKKNFNELVDDFELTLSSCAEELNGISSSTERLIALLSSKEENDIANCLRAIQESTSDSKQKIDVVLEQTNAEHFSDSIERMKKALDDSSGKTNQKLDVILKQTDLKHISESIEKLKKDLDFVSKSIDQKIDNIKKQTNNIPESNVLRRIIQDLDDVKRSNELIGKFEKTIDSLSKSEKEADKQVVNRFNDVQNKLNKVLEQMEIYYVALFDMVYSKINLLFAIILGAFGVFAALAIWILVKVW